MLAYAAHRRRIAERHSAPHAMLLIIAAHISVIAVVMSAKMDLPQRIFRPPTAVDLIPLPKDPPPEQPQARTEPKSNPSSIDRVPVIIPIPEPAGNTLDRTLIPLPISGTDIIEPKVDPLPRANPVRVGPRFATAPSEMRPPYPPSKIQSEEEALLTLRLSIDPRGRVVAVEPLGRTDPAFLAAARRHLIAHWRYSPATEDGRAIASSTVITLRFQLD
jgi:periplasmic protein TonB